MNLFVKGCETINLLVISTPCSFGGFQEIFTLQQVDAIMPKVEGGSGGFAVLTIICWAFEISGKVWFL